MRRRETRGPPTLPANERKTRSSGLTRNRYGLTNEDLNRRWSNPNQTLHPVIYHTKGLMEYCTRVLQKPPHVFVDYHGHSRRKNVFLFGCSGSGSWSPMDRAKPDQPVQYLMLPRLMQKTSPAFALPLCSFKVERHKESTARVAVWRQLGVSRSYTMESSFCGCDQGPLAGFHLDTMHLKEVGQNFCQALSMMKDGGEEHQCWTLDKSRKESCCPMNCVLGKCKKSSKCIQDRHAIRHIEASDTRIPTGNGTCEEEGSCMPDETTSSCESEFDD